MVINHLSVWIAAVFGLASITVNALSDQDILDTMAAELQRSIEILAKQPQPAYYLSYEISEVKSKTIGTDRGRVVRTGSTLDGRLDLDMRIGDPAFDNTRILPGTSRSTVRQPFSYGISFNSADALLRNLWRATTAVYKNQAPVYENLKQSSQLVTNMLDESPDFAHDLPHNEVQRDIKFKWDEEKWQKTLTTVSSVFDDDPSRIYSGTATLFGNITNTFFTNSEGSKIKQSRIQYRISLQVSGQNRDGEALNRLTQFFAFDPAGLPNRKELIKSAKLLKAELFALMDAPLAEPYSGPVILSGRASGVFFHEILGHRLEGHRLKLKTDAQTFKAKISEQILPESFSVISDPTIDRYDGIPLMGSYSFDNQGVRGKRVVVVENGILKNFLMSRSPIEDFPTSNGHGRKQIGFQPVARQSNLIIEANERVRYSKLMKMLIDEINKQGKDFGLLIDDISGGYTLTQRFMPNAFNVTPTMVYKVYPDGSQELVRGVDLIGTPLNAFSHIIGASKENGVFNGSCGAESGYVPVSAVAPAILLSQIELQKKMAIDGLLPILPPPQSQPEI